MSSGQRHQGSVCVLSESTIQQFNALRDGYLARLAERADQLRGTLARLDGEQQPDRGAMERLAGELHNLAGSGGTFGFPAISEAARRGEQMLQEVLEGHLIWNDSTRLLLGDALDELAGAVAAAREAEASPEPLPEEGPYRVLVLARQHELDDTATALMQFGYQVETVGDERAIATALHAGPAHALLTRFTEAAVRALEAARRNGQSLPPVVFIAERGDFATRLAALRAGGRAFLPDPPDTAELLDALEQLALPPAGVDYRVVLVDDEEDVGRYHGLLLERAGMQVTVLQKPAALLEQLSAWRPEVIVADFYMPDCDGLELAALLRQMPPAAGIPIIFLSSEQRLEHHIEAIRAGGDDFLAKPVRAQQFVSAVARNARQYRARQALTVRDSLTGLLHQKAVREQLRNEVLRAERQGSPLSIALLDIDHFRRVNDGFGTAAGDAALKALGHLLLQRLRRSDAVGRMGGEEFLLVLPGTVAGDACRVLDDIRERFGRLRHDTPAGDFTLELSAGVAELRPGETADALLARSDGALYAAKRAGRNRVSLAAD